MAFRFLFFACLALRVLGKRAQLRPRGVLSAGLLTLTPTVLDHSSRRPSASLGNQTPVLVSPRQSLADHIPQRPGALVSYGNSAFAALRQPAASRMALRASAVDAREAPKIKLYTNRMCPFAQRVWIALEASGLPFDMQEVSLYGGSGFNKQSLKQVEAEGGLKPKGYIPVMSVDDGVIRESSEVVKRVAQLSAETPGADSLRPELPGVADELIGRCNSLPRTYTSSELDILLGMANDQLGRSAFLAGDTFSVADACLLPFLQRVDDDNGIPDAASHLRSYMKRARKNPAFAKTVASNYWWWW